MDNHLKEIQQEDWTRLRDCYLPETPQTVLGLSTLNNYIRWTSKTPSFRNLTIYSLNGDWSDGTFIVIDRYHVYFDSLGKTNERVKDLLRLLDYSRGFMFMHVRSKHYPVILDIIKQKELKIEYDDPNLLYYMPKEDAIQQSVELPVGFHLHKLTNLDVIKANVAWAFNHPGSLYFLQRLASLNPSSGISTNDGDLASSCFQLQTGAIGTLYTYPAYRNRSLGTCIVRSMSKHIADLGSGVTACVKRANAASRAIFENIGYQIIDEVHWIAIPCDWNEDEN